MGLNRLGRMNFKSLFRIFSKISLFCLCVIAFAIGSAQGVGIPAFDGKSSVENIRDFWKGYDARKEPLKIQVVESWKTEDGEVRLVLYSLGKLQGSNKLASPVIAAYLGLLK